MEQASSGTAFNNISASPADCQQRQVRFHRFLNEFASYDSHEVEYSSQTSAVSGVLILNFFSNFRFLVFLVNLFHPLVFLIVLVSEISKMLLI